MMEQLWGSAGMQSRSNFGDVNNRLQRNKAESLLQGDNLIVINCNGYTSQVDCDLKFTGNYQHVTKIDSISLLLKMLGRLGWR